MFQTENRPLPHQQERWNDARLQHPYNLFFALLPEPEIVSQVADLGTTVCRAHRFRGKPVWPDRLHMTLLSAVDPDCGLIENVNTATRAADRIDAVAFDVALDITESFQLRRESHPFVLASGDGVAAATTLRRSIADALTEEGFGVQMPRDFTLHMTLMWADRWVDEYPILPIRWTVREFALVLSHVGKSRHEHLAKWALHAKEIWRRKKIVMAKSIIIYGIKNCDTIKKARAWLDGHGVSYVFHDYKVEGIERAKLESWLKQVGWETALNRAGTTFRKLPDKDRKGVTEKKAIALMLAQPSMIKRPVLEAGGKLIVGFKPEAYAKAFGK